MVYVLALHHSAISVLDHGKTKQVEGTIQQLEVHPDARFDAESFTIADARFSYSDGEVYNPGFNLPHAHGGPIVPGLYVRISYAHIWGVNRILRLDVRHCS
jgi:hypothetical protein